MFKFLMDPEVKKVWGGSETELLRVQKEVWERKPLLQRIYREWWDLMIKELVPTGRTLEIGAGIGEFRRYWKDASLVSTDILAVPDIQVRCDAERLPFRDGSFTNIVGVDFIHHLGHPQAFLDEASRVLARHGRLVAIEPYLSPFADLITKYFHHEADERHHEADSGAKKDALTADVRLPTEIFVKNPDKLARSCPQLRIRTAHLHTTTLAYALSGGFTYRSFLPGPLVPLVDAFDRIATAPLRRLTAFKILVAIEKV